MNRNQEIVLEHLKRSGKVYPIFNVHQLHEGIAVREVLDAYETLSHEQEFEVLEHYGRWGQGGNHEKDNR